MRNTIVAYGNWDVLVEDEELIFKCTLSEGIGNKQFVRAYDIPSDTKEILFEMPYIRLEHDSRLTEFKCEGDSCIIGEVWEDGEHIDSIAMHDFWDEWTD
jgi:hypothetical protein